MNEPTELQIQEFERIIANPFYCMNIDESMCLKHEPLTSKEAWIKSAMNAIKEDADGGEKFLTNLLENLQGNYI